jgi:benzoyl-CoA reductase/2-hydroxyglutaryl-CoA dehydratase subunit BcrC/BadD/HgdB
MIIKSCCEESNCEAELVRELAKLAGGHSAPTAMSAAVNLLAFIITTIADSPEDFNDLMATAKDQLDSLAELNCRLVKGGGGVQ